MRSEQTPWLIQSWCLFWSHVNLWLGFLWRNAGLETHLFLCDTVQVWSWYGISQAEFEYLKLPGWNLNISSGIWVSQASGLEFAYLKLPGWNLSISSFRAGIWISQAEFEYLKLRGWNLNISSGIWVSQASLLEFEYLKLPGWNLSISSFRAGIWVSQAEFEYLKRNLSISSFWVYSTLFNFAIRWSCVFAIEEFLSSLGNNCRNYYRVRYQKEYGLYSPTSIHPPPCTYTYLGARDDNFWSYNRSWLTMGHHLVQIHSFSNPCIFPSSNHWTTGTSRPAPGASSQRRLDQGQHGLTEWPGAAGGRHDWHGIIPDPGVYWDFIYFWWTNIGKSSIIWDVQWDISWEHLTWEYDGDLLGRSWDIQPW